MAPEQSLTDVIKFADPENPRYTQHGGGPNWLKRQDTLKFDPKTGHIERIVRGWRRVDRDELRREWVSSFLTALQHNIGYIQIYTDKIIKKNNS